MNSLNLVASKKTEKHAYLNKVEFHFAECTVESMYSAKLAPTRERVWSMSPV